MVRIREVSSLILNLSIRLLFINNSNIDNSSGLGVTINSSSNLNIINNN